MSGKKIQEKNSQKSDNDFRDVLLVEYDNKDNVFIDYGSKLICSASIPNSLLAELSTYRSKLKIKETVEDNNYFFIEKIEIDRGIFLNIENYICKKIRNEYAFLDEKVTDEDREKLDILYRLLGFRELIKLKVEEYSGKENVKVVLG